ncbi:hypothetical protein Tco_1132042 [Tanacetum coccineum]|uniref:No apical meristem-associated C-terminal domain-containing protein n=1 Tax=Tanacetum coccineum TaxID=301880 RepID=A0ABQ5JBF4_9ASTR
MCQIFCKLKFDTNKKSKTSENTSFNTSNSRQGGFNLNDETDNLDEVDVREVQLKSRDKAKKKEPFSPVPSESSASSPFVDLLVHKWKNVYSGHFSKKDEDQASLLEIKQQRLMELKLQEYAQMQEEIELRRQILNFQKEKLCHKEILFYNSRDDHMTGRLRRC